MDSRERLRRCYFHEAQDRPGVYVRTGFPAGDPTYDRVKACLNAHSDLKRGWNSGLVESPDPIDYRMEEHSEDWQRRVAVLHSPAGELRSSHLLSLKGLPGLHETHFLKSRADAQTYLSLPLPQLDGEASAFFAAVDAIGDRGIVEVSLGSNPAGFVAGLFGSEMLALMSVTDRDVLHALCERRMAVTMARLKYVLGLGVGPYFAMAGEEFLVPPLHGPKDFHDFNVRYDRPIIDLIHQAGGRVHIHCHGSIRKVIQGFVDMGVDVLHPFEAPPMGDITPAQAKAAARGRLTLEGNIQIAAMYEHTPEQMRAETQALIETVFDDRKGLIVCPSASPYQRGKGEQCFENFKAMVDTVVNWSR